MTSAPQAPTPQMKTTGEFIAEKWIGALDGRNGKEASALAADVAQAILSAVEAERQRITSLELQLEGVRERLYARLNDHLCEMKEGYDDSIVGFNEAWDVMREVFEDAEKQSLGLKSDKFKCRAREGNTHAGDPADCDWPVCGCDPHADKVIAALQERDAIPPAPSQIGEKVNRLVGAMERAVTYVEMTYDEEAGEEAAEAKHDLDMCRAALSAVEPYLTPRKP